MKQLFRFFTLIFFFISISTNCIYSQVELVPVEDPVYDFLKRMQLKDIIEYNSSDIPISRNKVSSFIEDIESKSGQLSQTDKKILDDLKIKFSFDLSGSLNKSQGLLNDGKFKIFEDDKQKYLYMFADSNASFFFDGIGTLSQGFSKGDTIQDRALTLGKAGFRLRGTILNSVGFYLRADNGIVLSGNPEDRKLGIADDSRLTVNSKYLGDGFFESYEGHLRFALKQDIFSMIIGKQSVKNGFGYLDQMFLSDNTVSYSYFGVNVNYKAIDYSFRYASLKGDTLGIKDIAMKNLVTHRLTLTISNRLRFGVFESLVTVDRPFNLTYLVPLSLLRAADYNAGSFQSGSLNNALMGFDVEYLPVKNWAVQGTLLIDDLNFSNLFKDKLPDGKPVIDNRFGIQFGTIWTDAFSISDLTAAFEYTWLGQFVYTHRSNKAQYTNWALPLAHQLSPNSDEIGIKLDYNFTSRLKANFLFRFQRSAKGIVIENDKIIINYGGDINRGDGDEKFPFKFLSGNRINRYLFDMRVSWEPIRQYFFDLKFVYGKFDNIFNNTQKNLTYGFLNFRIDY